MSEQSSGGAQRATADTDPAEMSDSDLRSEWDEIAGLLDYGGVTNVAEDKDTLYERRRTLWKEMESRADAEPPECPRCGAQDWSQSLGEPKVCGECDLHLGFDQEDLTDEIDAYWNTVRSVGAGRDRSGGTHE